MVANAVKSLEFGTQSEYSGFDRLFTLAYSVAQSEAGELKIDELIRDCYDEDIRSSLVIEWMDGDDENGSYLVTMHGDTEDCEHCSEIDTTVYDCEECGAWTEYIVYRLIED